MSTLPLHDRVVVPVNFAARPAYRFPHEVLLDQALSTPEKREILSGWASDANTVPSFPALRRLPGTLNPVTLSSIMHALSQLDADDGPLDDPPREAKRARLAA